MNKKTIFDEVPEFEYRESNPEIIIADEFVKVVESRRSVRVFTNDEIPKATMEKIFDLALLAPNSSNLQPWEFYWVQDPGKKEKLIEYCMGQPAATTARELVVAVARTDSWKQHCSDMIKVFDQLEMKIPQSAYLYYKKLAPLAYNQGPLSLIGFIKKIIVFFYGTFKVVPRGPFSEGEMIRWASVTTALACENMMLSARAFGYDSCPMEGFDAKRTADLLDLTGKAYPVMVIGFGKRDPKGIYGPRIRFPKERFIKKL